MTRGETRGEIWTAAGGKGCAGKPRPIVIVQDDRFDATSSITVCAFTNDPTDAGAAQARPGGGSTGLRVQAGIGVREDSHE